MSEKPRHPMQPIVEDKYGVLRFKANAIVRFLLDAGPLDLNKLALMNWSNEDREQLAMLIGYSVDGFQDLQYVSDKRVKEIDNFLEVRRQAREGDRQLSRSQAAIQGGDMRRVNWVKVWNKFDEWWLRKGFEIPGLGCMKDEIERLVNAELRKKKGARKT